jgi:hypothetical protein
MKIILNEEQFKLYETYIINKLFEDDNPAFSRSNAKKYNGVSELWELIDKKQKELHNAVFGELGDKLDSLTIEKSKLMGKQYLSIPNVMCHAGNQKLPENVLIINMSSSLMCPSFYLGLCRITNGACYAQRAENQYTTTVMPQRFQTDLMHTQMLTQYQKGNKDPMRQYFRLIELYIQLANKYATEECRNIISNTESKLRRKLTKEEKDFVTMINSKNKITDVRLNETGDFHCQLAVNLWAKFAKKIKRKYGIDTHAYTARNLDFSKASNYINMNYSHEGEYDNENVKPRFFRAVKDAYYNNLPETGIDENFQPILGTNEKGEKYYKCPCGQDESACDKCGVCFKKNTTGCEYTIFVKYHGLKNASGLKSAYTRNEIKPIVDMYKQNGWTTEKEAEKSDSNQTKEKLDIFSKNVERLRNADKKKKEKPKKTKTKKVSK